MEANEAEPSNGSANTSRQATEKKPKFREVASKFRSTPAPKAPDTAATAAAAAPASKKPPASKDSARPATKSVATPKAAADALRTSQTEPPGKAKAPPVVPSTPSAVVGVPPRPRAASVAASSGSVSAAPGRDPAAAALLLTTPRARSASVDAGSSRPPAMAPPPPSSALPAAAAAAETRPERAADPIAAADPAAAVAKKKPPGDLLLDATPKTADEAVELLTEERDWLQTLCFARTLLANSARMQDLDIQVKLQQRWESVVAGQQAHRDAELHASRRATADLAADAINRLGSAAPDERTVQAAAGHVAQLGDALLQTSHRLPLQQLSAGPQLFEALSCVLPSVERLLLLLERTYPLLVSDAALFTGLLDACDALLAGVHRHGAELVALRSLVERETAQAASSIMRRRNMRATDAPVDLESSSEQDAH